MPSPVTAYLNLITVQILLLCPLKNTCACLKQAWMRGLVLDVLMGPLGWYGGCKAFTTQKDGSVIHGFGSDV